MSAAAAEHADNFNDVFIMQFSPWFAVYVLARLPDGLPGRLKRWQLTVKIAGQTGYISDKSSEPNGFKLAAVDPS